MIHDLLLIERKLSELREKAANVRKDEKTAVALDSLKYKYSDVMNELQWVDKNLEMTFFKPVKFTAEDRNRMMGKNKRSVR